MNYTLKEVIGRGDHLFNSRGSFMSLLQSIAENFYPERADFTLERVIGEEFVANLYSGYPIIVRRELANAFSSMLRPTNTEWAHVTVEDSEDLSTEARQFLEHAAKVQRRHMYDRRAMFIRATKQADNDFAAFGQCVITHEIDWQKPSLLYRNWHLRDCAWQERYDGSVGEMHRNWKPRISELARQFGEGKLHPSMQRSLRSDKNASAEGNIRVVTIPSEEYGSTIRQPFRRITIDVANCHEIENVPQWTFGHVVPRWQTVSGSQYAFSPATVAGLPDARLLQAMTLTLLEAGEMAVRPPLLALEDVIREDMNWYPGGITVADSEYDQRLGDVLRPISQDTSALPFGMDFQNDTRSMLATAFFLNKITLPPSNSKEMTAYETSERIQEYIREAAPLFEPMEYEYNAVLCEDTFDHLLRAGAFGPPQNIPKELQGREIHFQFESPLHDAIERKKGNQFMESRQLLMMAAEIDAPSIATMNVRDALRSALHGIGTPAAWLNSKDVVDAHAQAYSEETEQHNELNSAAQAAGAAKQLAEAGAAQSAKA